MVGSVPTFWISGFKEFNIETADETARTVLYVHLTYSVQAFGTVDQTNSQAQAPLHIIIKVMRGKPKGRIRSNHNHHSRLIKRHHDLTHYPTPTCYPFQPPIPPIMEIRKNAKQMLLLYMRPLTSMTCSSPPHHLPTSPTFPHKKNAGQMHLLSS